MKQRLAARERGLEPRHRSPVANLARRRVTDPTGLRLFLGLFLSAAIGGLAYRQRALSSSGVLGAVLLGTVIFGFGGWVWGGALIAFFVSSSALSHYRSHQKAGLAEKFAKGSRRDLGQTLANGGLAGLLALLAGVVGSQSRFYVWLSLAFCGALATVNADTWATELGVLAGRQPRLIINGRPVPVGTSGGVTAQGFLAALTGAGLIGATVFVLSRAATAGQGNMLPEAWVVIPVAALSGLAGSVLDSVLGATVQAMYVCDACNTETERKVHRCNQATRQVRGWRWLDNDGVNFLASVGGALVSAGLGALLF